MSPRWGTTLALVAVLLSPVAAAAQEQRAAPAHIAAVRAFLVAWGHERWDDLRDVSADAVTVKLADRVFTLDPAARKSAVAVRLPFRGLSTIRSGAEVTGVAVDDLAVRIGDEELRGPATVTVRDEAGQFRVVGVLVESSASSAPSALPAPARDLAH